jgi:phosphohistidine phosphatase
MENTRMKKLLIMRHAKSCWKYTDLSDHERPLKKRGKNDAKKMGKLLKSKKIIPDVIICSTAERAKETADLLIEGMKYKNDVIMSDALYMAEPSHILSAINENAKKQKTVMVIGHNPGSEALLQILTGKVESLPTASIAYVTAKIDSWKEIEKCKDVKLKKLWRPKDIK